MLITCPSCSSFLNFRLITDKMAASAECTNCHAVYGAQLTLITESPLDAEKLAAIKNRNH